MKTFRSTLFHLARMTLALALFGLLAIAAFAQGRGGEPRQAGASQALPTLLRGTTLTFGKAKAQLLTTPPRAPLAQRRKVDGEDRDADGKEERHTLPVVPEGPFVPSGSAAPTPAMRALRGKEGVGARANTDAVRFTSITSLDSAAHSNATSVVMEPSTASSGNVVMYTGNWFAAVSSNGGASFNYINPYTTFPASDGGFCCDQVLQYLPSIDRFVWLLQYIQNGSGENRQRLAVASPAQAAAGTWSYVDVTSASLGFTNQWLDYPALGFSSNFLYLTSNVFNSSDQFTRTVCVRFALSDIADGGGATFAGFQMTDVGSLHPSQNGGTRAYIATHNSTSSLRVIHWDDSSSTAVSHSVTVPTWGGGAYSSLTPGNFNWLGRVDSRITAATVVGGEVWFGWTSAAGGAHSYPQPFVNIVRVDGTSFAFLGDDRLIQFGATAAAAYPSLSTNSNGEVAITYAWGGGGVSVPNTAVGFLTGGDRRQWSFTSGTHGPSAQVWGDYLTIRVDGENPKLFSATGFSLQGGNSNGFSVPKYVRFGRAFDTSGAIQPDIYEVDDSLAAAKTLTVGQTQFRNIHAEGNLDFATFTLAAPANLILATDGEDGDTVMSLYGPNNSATLLEEDDDDGNDLFSSITRTLAAGTYWVKIEEFNGNEFIPGYSLALTVSSASLQVTAPNGGESFAVGSNQNITWNSSNVSGNVQIEFSSDGGSNWSTIIADTPNDGSHSWMVPNTPTMLGRVKVSALDLSASDTSDANFTIPAPPVSITVTAPNGGETLVAGSSQSITWTSSNVVGNVQLQFSNDGGTNWSAIADTANDGSEGWTVPALATTQGRVRVVALNNSASDISNANFTIVLPTLTVTAPNGGETYLAGTLQVVLWSSTNVTGNVQIEFSSDGGGTWSTVAASTANDGGEGWIVPAVSTTQGRVRVSALNGAANDLSNGNFTVLLPTLTVTAPNGGESLVADSVRTITWTSLDVTGNVQIEFSSNGGGSWSTITASTVNDGTESWTVPATGTSQGRIRISAINGSATDTSDANFSVLLPTLTVTAPNGGESYPINAPQTIMWTSANVSGNVKLEFSGDGGANWTVLNASTANDGSETWNTPGTTTSQGRIRIMALDGSATDTSNANFSLTYTGGTLKTSPAKLAFGTVKVGASKVLKAVITNKSKTQNLMVSVGITGAPFSITSGTGPFTLLPKGKTTVFVRFVPAAVGIYTGTLTVNSSDPLLPMKVIPITARGK